MTSNALPSEFTVKYTWCFNGANMLGEEAGLKMEATKTCKRWGAHPFFLLFSFPLFPFLCPTFGPLPFKITFSFPLFACAPMITCHRHSFWVRLDLAAPVS